MIEKEKSIDKKIFYCQGGIFSEKDDCQNLIEIHDKIIDFLNVKNLYFLFGAGTSSDSIPNMAKLLTNISDDIASEDVDLSKESKILFQSAEKQPKSNLETLLGTLYAKRAYLDGIGDKDEHNDKLINYIENTIYKSINIDTYDEKYKKSLDLYKMFYQKLANRNKDLARINIFTLNNDVFNESALDQLNIHYNNGFGGGLNRVFNPALFSYTFSQKIDSNLEKYEPILNMVYLYKLHGSINWIEDETITNSFFNIKEVPFKPNTDKSDNNILIYPTPLKQNKSLGCPYSDLIREFQKKLLFSHSVLFIIGYSFSDEHINNIIYQALATNTSLSIVIFGKYEDKILTKINDSRIYQIWGKDENKDDVDEFDKNIHYFKYIVNDLLPNLNENQSKLLLKEFSENLNSLIEKGK